MKKTILKFIAAALTAVLTAATLGGCNFFKNKTDEYTDTRFLMDTVCSIRSGGENAQAAVTAAFERAEKIAAAVDYFSADSEVAAINRAKANEPISVSDDTAAILRTALEIYKSSDGAFDITIASVKDLWQFSSGAHQPPPPSEINSTLENVGSDKILLNGNTVTKTADKVKIDLGGAAKGYAVDCAKAVLGEYNAEYALIDFGGSIGVVGRNPSRRGGEWSVGLQKPFGKSGEYTKIIEISDKSVVTSGTYQRYFKWNGEIYHHIIDPKSGYPSKSGISGVSIICGSALLADCLSTAYLVMGKDGGDRLIQMYGATAEVE